MKYIHTFLFLIITISAFSQDYIEPITKKRVTGILTESADSMTLEKILGCSKFAVPSKAWSCSYSPDGKFVVIGGYNYIACFNQQNGEKIWGKFVQEKPKYPIGNPVRTIAIHQETNRLIFGADDGKIYLLNFKTGETEKVLGENLGWVMAVAISPNGRFGAGTDIKGGYKMWDLKTGREMPLPNIPNGRGEAVCFSSDGKFLAIGGNNCFHIIDWDNQTSVQYNTPSTVQSIAFINQNKEVLISGWTGFVQRIHLESKEILWQYKTKSWVINLRVLPNQTSALAISPNHVLHLDWENDTVTNTFIPVRTAMDLHPDGETILTIGPFANRSEQMNWKTKEAVYELPFYNNLPMKLAFSPDGKFLATGSYYQKEKGIIWETNSWKIAALTDGYSLHGFRIYELTENKESIYTTTSSGDFSVPKSDTSPYQVPIFSPVKSYKRNRKAYHHTSVNLESTKTVHLKKLLPIHSNSFNGALEPTLNRHLFGGWTIEKVYFAGVTNEHILYIFNSKTGEKVAGTPLPDFEVAACAIHPEAKMVAVVAWDGLIYIYRW